MPNTSLIQVVVLYGAPSVPVEALINVISRVLNHVAASGISLGDFNEDILCYSDSRLATSMSDHGYTQLVHVPTTDRGTLIGHVYYSHLSDQIILEIQGTYYITW